MSLTHRNVKPGDHVFLVDGSNFIFRAYFQSIRQDQKYNYRSDRLPVGAVRLFCAKIFQFVRDGAIGIKPTHLAIIFDKSENSFRKAFKLVGTPMRIELRSAANPFEGRRKPLTEKQDAQRRRRKIISKRRYG